MNTDKIAELVRHVLQDEHHFNLCACDSWPTECANGLTLFTFSPEDVVRVAAPLIIEDWEAFQ